MTHRRTLWAVAALAVVLLLTGAGIAVVLANREDPPPAVAAPTPTPTASASPSPAPPPGAEITGPLNLMLVGVDTRASIPDWEPHADAIMLLHLDAGLRRGYLTSLPRDLRVETRFGRHKITEAMSRGSRVRGTDRPDPRRGLAVLTQAVEDYTGIRTIDAAAVLTFTGMSRLVDGLGGITVDVDQKVVSQHRRPDGTLRTLRSGGGGYVGPQKTYLPGTRRMNGWQALDYSRQRYTEGGDYTRQRHQRQLVEAMLTAARASGTASDPVRLQALVDALGELLVYQGAKTPIEYAYALRALTPESLTLVGLPGGSVTSSGGAYLGEEVRKVGRDYLRAVSRNQAAQFLSRHRELPHD